MKAGAIIVFVIGVLNTNTKNHLQSLFSHFESRMLPGDSLCISTQSVDSFDGGSTDALKKGPLEKKLVEKIVLSYLCFY